MDALLALIPLLFLFIIGFTIHLIIYTKFRVIFLVFYIFSFFVGCVFACNLPRLLYQHNEYGLAQIFYTAFFIIAHNFLGFIVALVFYYNSSHKK